MKLNIPEQVPANEDDFPTHPRKVKKWLEGLKQANMGDYTRLVYNGLLKLNRTAMPPDHRFENMEMLRQPLRHIFNQLHKQFVNRTLPLPEKSLKIVNLNQTLLSEMAMGYKILVFEASNDITRVDSKHVLIACERALHYLSEMLLRYSQIYTEQPKGNWWDIHHVYAYAETKRLHQKSVKDSELKSGASTVEDLYKQILLFSLAKPNSMRQSDADRVYKSMPGWVQRTALSSKPVANNLNRHYCCRLDRDLPPACITAEEMPDADSLRIISTAALVNYLRSQIDETDMLSNGVAFGDQVSQETLRALVTAWSLCSKRRFSRAVREAEIKVSIGLNPIFESLTAETATPSKQKEKKHPSMFSLESIPESARVNRDIFSQQDPNIFITHPELRAEKDKSAANWDLVGRGRTLTEGYTSELQKQQNEMGDVNKEAPDLHWQISNVSAGGYCLRWASENPSRALVGELIGVREREPDSTFQWRVGIIRWMQYSYQTGLEIGVQILSPKVISCTVQRIERKNEQPFRCLMLPGIKPIQQPSTLLMPAHAFRKGNPLKLNVYERDMDISLGTIREHTGSFTQFQFTQKSEEPAKTGGNTGGGTPDTASQKKTNPDDFDSIWSSL
ncbi:MAG: cyclic-di-GMP-binding protein [Pseudomonadota bacterium]|nr:cyclic-di-GMP-binding protein [Pseudomonadota bacterium]